MDLLPRLVYVQNGSEDPHGQVALQALAATQRAKTNVRVSEPTFTKRSAILLPPGRSSSTRQGSGSSARGFNQVRGSDPRKRISEPHPAAA